jgi:hypothetical protein
MSQTYHLFISEWRKCLSDYERIFSSINTYSILKYLKEYWNSRNTKISGFEKVLVFRLVDIIEQKEPDIRIIENLDNSAVRELERKTKLLLQPMHQLNENTINAIDKVISLCHCEQFKIEIFNRIFILPQNESVYLIHCILRILIEEHSKEFLDALPVPVFVKYLLQKHNQEIVNLLNHESMTNVNIFNDVLEFIRDNLIPKTKDLQKL